MNVKNPRLILGLLALLAIIGIGGFFLGKSENRDTRIVPSATTTSTQPEIIEKPLTEFDLSKWEEHRGIYRIKASTPNSKYGVLVKDCNYWFMFDSGSMTYAYRGGTIASVKEDLQCDPSFLVKARTEKYPSSELGFSFYKKTEQTEDVYEVDGRYYTSDSASFQKAVVESGGAYTLKRFYIDGRPADQIRYVAHPSNEGDTGVQVYTWVYGDSGTLLILLDGEEINEDLYQAIISTVHFDPTTVTATTPGWRLLPEPDSQQLLDITKSKTRILGSGKTTLSLPPLFFEPNNANTDVPDMSYSLREESLSSFPVSDTPWHTSADILQEKAFIAGGKVIPSIHSGAEKVVRYSSGSVQGYFAYDCLKTEGENALSTIFTFFDQTHRYRLELLETKPEWSSQETFTKTCTDRIANIEQGNLDQESAVKYQVLKEIIETIKKN